MSRLLNHKRRMGKNFSAGKGNVEYLKIQIRELIRERNDLERRNRKLCGILKKLNGSLEQEKEKSLKKIQIQWDGRKYKRWLVKQMEGFQSLLGLADLYRTNDEMETAVLARRTAVEIRKIRKISFDSPEEIFLFTAMEIWEERWKRRKGNLDGRFHGLLEMLRESSGYIHVSRYKEVKELICGSLRNFWRLIDMNNSDCSEQKMKGNQESFQSGILSGDEQALLFETAGCIWSALVSLGYYPVFYGSELYRGILREKPEMASYYNRGNEFSLELPAIFIYRGARDGWELFSGCSGLTQHIILTRLSRSENS